jgi:hypothetical protein
VKAVVKRIFGYAADDQPSDVTHVCHQHRADFVANLGKLGVIQLARIGREAGQDDFWPMFQRQTANFFIVNFASLDILDAVADEFIFAG